MSLASTSGPVGLNKATPHSLLPYLRTQTASALNRLYQRPSSCLPVFRLLDPLSRQIVMNLLWLDSSMPITTMLSWITMEGQEAFDEAMVLLSALRILDTKDGNPSEKLLLSATFKRSLRQALTGGDTSASFGVPAEPEDHKTPPTVAALDGYAVERWETILHYMVSSGTGAPVRQPSLGVLHLLTEGKLMASWTGNPQNMRITSDGFQFLLHTPHEQLWQLLLQYLSLAEGRRMDPVEVLSFFFMLSTMELGWEYATASLSVTQQAMLEDLRDYGLVWQRKPKSRRFCPTRLATTLTSSLPSLPTSSAASTNTAATASETGATAEGFIILETNYRVYAYTNNPLQTAVLNLFVNMKARFPNLVVGMITRESVRRALTNGITAEQIISYLTTYAHPQMRKYNPLIPVTVQDQIRLWELERNRMKSDDGYLYTDFSSQGDYELLLDYAKRQGFVLWESAPRRAFVGRASGHASIKSFVEQKGMPAGNVHSYG
ncbi:unnamed protein product [Peniophora sp. CBMAI 1063]|nr:unnamed protein product [Peniophora sp. CBMAI 1063]